MTELPELLPCPFCGSVDTGHGDDGTDNRFPGQFFVFCAECDAQGPCEHVEGPTWAVEDDEIPAIRAKAAAKWNHRPTPAAARIGQLGEGEG